jgi:hypothetical protein
MVPLRWLIPLAALATSSCVPSLQPLFGPADTFDDPGILGTWREGKIDRTWVVTRGKDSTLAIRCTEDGESRTLRGRLGRIGNDVFLDLYPDQDLDLKNTLFAGHFLPVHCFYKIERKGREMTVRGLDDDVEEAAARSGDARIRMSEDTPVFVGTTPELQQFFRVNAGKPGFLEDAVKFARID